MTPRQSFVKVAQHAVGGKEDVLVTLGLGSCVAIVLQDRAAGVGGMAHVLLPEPSLARDASNPAKFAATAVPLLLEEMGRLGARAGRLEARLVGGASMFASLMGPGSLNMGERNVRASREALRKAGIPIVAEEVGADYGRSVRFWVGEGRTVVSSVGKGDIVL
ncbi:MAG TPA: chemotaxis protein CheD [Longimicrobiaceae bacterium]|jgi:chemotaxis protein CheD|nr:chemotaxis protein CheD [Longimicrobiaceae bacterium]